MSHAEIQEAEVDDVRGRSLPGVLGAVVVVLAAAVEIAAVAALHWEVLANRNVTIWDVSTATGTTLVAVGGAIFVLGVLTILWRTAILPAVALGLSGYLIAAFFPSSGVNFGPYEIGFGIAAGASVAGAVASVVLVVDATRVRGTRAPGAATSAHRLSEAALAPEGWYPDPSEPGRERYWSGSDWTAQTRRP